MAIAYLGLGTNIVDIAAALLAEEVEIFSLPVSMKRNRRGVRVENFS